MLPLMLLLLWTRGDKNTGTHMHTHTRLLATIRALPLCDLSTHTTTHSNSIDIRTLMLILTLRMRICDTFAPTSLVIATLNTAEVPPVATPSRTPHSPKLLLPNYEARWHWCC